MLQISKPITAAILLLASTSYAVATTDIQMLPPTPPASNTACSDKTSNILTYSGSVAGQAGINCMPNTSIDPTGNVKSNTLTVGAAQNADDACSAALLGQIVQNADGSGQLLTCHNISGVYKYESAFGSTLSTALVGYCSTDAFAPVKAPAIKSGAGYCSCATGYTKVQTGEGAQICHYAQGAEFCSNGPDFYSCIAN